MVPTHYYLGCCVALSYSIQRVFSCRRSSKSNLALSSKPKTGSRTRYRLLSSSNVILFVILLFAYTGITHKLVHHDPVASATSAAALDETSAVSTAWDDSEEVVVTSDAVQQVVPDDVKPTLPALPEADVTPPRDPFPDAATRTTSTASNSSSSSPDLLPESELPSLDAAPSAAVSATPGQQQVQPQGAQLVGKDAAAATQAAPEDSASSLAQYFISQGSVASREHTGMPPCTGCRGLFLSELNGTYLQNSHLLLHSAQLKSAGTIVLDICDSGDTVKTRFKFTEGTLELLQQHDTDMRFGTCAVVGNSGMLLKRRQGAEIDSHDAVLRINLAVTKGYEVYVGTKTTFDFSNHPNAENAVKKVQFLRNGHLMPADRTVPVRHVIDAAYSGTHHGEAATLGTVTNSTLVLFESIHRSSRRHLYERALDHFPTTKIVSPDFILAASHLWEQKANAVLASSPELRKRRFSRTEGDAATQKVPRALSGWYALMFMTQICSKVNVYGFDSYMGSRSPGVSGRRSQRRNGADLRATSNTAEVPYHYFNQVQGQTGVHAFDVTIQVMEGLAPRYDVNILKYN
ncbi:glycosyltransferase 29 protein [Cymbomonas tetramitiformis]|uniref:Glycosyltransferase 29 protein n=1 Tax=Cymbomonas tetramitiformis TaxID=36881 RepID=A0AAE0CAI7_9CHLO|nr:glycosyltransferase 29 protein [Cymbomonas tetramitiformis]